MRKLQLVLLLSALLFISCQSDSEKADKLRLENKFEEAAELYKKAAEDGDAYALWCLSNAYYNGDGVEYDEQKAFDLLKQAAEKGCEEAKCEMALAYMFGWYGISKDSDKGKSMLEELIKNTENSYVMARYASLKFEGAGPYEEDKEKAMSILDKVKDKNDSYYLYAMGLVYLKGTDYIDIDINKSIEYFSKAFNKGRRYSAYFLQSLYKGYGDLKRDDEKRIEWLNRGIESNVTDCMVEMAWLCLSEDSAYQNIHNPQKGIELLKKAAKHGNGEAYDDLGSIYYNGKFLQKDDSKAFECFQKATELKSANGAFNLGFAYLNGTGCEKNIAKGIETWKLAVKYGSGAAANNLFCYYYYGYYGGTKKDKEQAKKYLLKAAELRNDMGCRNLGLQYYTGKDLVDKDEQQAFVYMKMAADTGLVVACESLAYFYENGIGCKRNPQKAKEYRDKTIVQEDKKGEQE